MNNNLPMICYWCGTPLSKGTCKREHVPPRGFFPKGYREGLLTVPACDEHNTKLSQLDETFQFLIKAIGSNEIAVDHFKEKGVRMLQREESKKFAESLKRSSFYAEIEKVQRLVFSVDVEYTDKFVEKVVRGLFFLHNKKPVQGTVVNFSHEFFNPATDYRQLEDILFSDNDIINNLTNGDCQNPDVFNYRYLNCPDKFFFVVMEFYQGVVFVAWIMPNKFFPISSDG